MQGHLLRLLPQGEARLLPRLPSSQGGWNAAASRAEEATKGARKFTNLDGPRRSRGGEAPLGGRRPLAAASGSRRGDWPRGGGGDGGRLPLAGRRQGRPIGGQSAGSSSCKRMESQALDSDSGVDESLVAPLLELGIPEVAARRALALTGGRSAEAAAQLYFSSGLDSQEEEDAQGSGYYKMVFVVNMELSMGTGKIAAQVGHAAVGLFQLLQEKSSHRDIINQWDEQGAKKVVLQGSNTDQLLELHALALSLELPTYLVQDAGRTQVPTGSHTVLAIMGEEEMVNQVTGQLKLLN
ncbi:putative peptidyl-tRNA hydrolase 2 isoform X2 [Podarcis muralis]